MRMIPWLALVLIVANLGFCVWTQGGFGGSLPPPGTAQREPERLRQQVRQRGGDSLAVQQVAPRERVRHAGEA